EPRHHTDRVWASEPIDPRRLPRAGIGTYHLPPMTYHPSDDVVFARDGGTAEPDRIHHSQGEGQRDESGTAQTQERQRQPRNRRDTHRHPDVDEDVEHEGGSDP